MSCTRVLVWGLMTCFSWPLTLWKVQEVRAYPACVVSRSVCFPKSFHQAINLHLPSECCVQWTNLGFGVFINWARMKWTRQVCSSRVTRHRWVIFPSPQLSSQWLATSWKTWGYFLSIFETVVWRVLRWRSWLVLMVMAGGGDGGGGGSCPMGCSRPVSVWLTSALGSLWTGSPIKPAISGKVDSSAHSLACQWIRGRKTSGFPWVKSSALSEPQLYWLLLS